MVIYQRVCHWNNLPLAFKQFPSKDTFKYQVKCLLYTVVVYLCRKAVYMYVLNFNDREFFGYLFSIFYQMIVISIMCRVIFSEYYFKYHIGNKCT